MSQNLNAVAWAALTILWAFIAKAEGLSDSATFGIIAGLSGAAVGTLYGRKNQCWRSSHG